MNAYKTILIHCDAGEIAPARLEIGLQLGAQFDAHVAVLYALSAVPEPSVGYQAT